MTGSEEPLNSGLLVANGEFLTTRDFLSMGGLGARLAVLSACETGVPDMKTAGKASFKDSADRGSAAFYRLDRISVFLVYMRVRKRKEVFRASCSA